MFHILVSGTIMPIYVARKMETHFYEKAHIIIPLCAGIVALCVMTVGMLLYCKRRREMHHIKGRQLCNSYQRTTTCFAL